MPDSIEEPLLRLARLLDVQEVEISSIRRRVHAMRVHDEFFSLQRGMLIVDPRLPDMERKLQQALKELSALVGIQTLPPGMGDDATKEPQPTSDEATRGLDAIQRALRADIIKKLRPDLATRDPELTPEELEAEYEDFLKGAKK